MNLEQAIASVRAPDRAAMEETQRRLDSIIHPLSSLGKLEDHLVRIAGMTGSADFNFAKKAVAVFCADNGVVAQGISQSGQEVTAIVTENLATGDTCVCAMGRIAGADIIPVDIGVAADLDVPGLRRCKVAHGTRDFTGAPAMTREQAVQALEVGIGLAAELKERGYGLAAIGEMGIGNTTTSAAMASVLLGCPVEEVTGRGAGLSTEGLRRKVDVICKAIDLHRPDPSDLLDVLAKVGGFDIAGMAGFCIGGAVCGLPVVLDGVISCVAALTACGIAPGTQAFLLPSHTSAEPAGRLLLERLKLRPPLEADMRLGEGTGAVATFPLYDMMLEVYNCMVVFDDENMDAYEKLC